jgi:hypothetical protein
MADLDALFPADAWQRDTEGVPPGIIMFRYKQSDLRVVMIPGLYPGTTKICGSYLLFRSGDDSMNMECSVGNSIASIKAMIRTAVELSGHVRLSHDKFLANFARWIAEKTLRKISDETPADVATAAARAPNEPSAPQKRESGDSDNVAQKAARREPSPEPENTCCICLSATADTTALPCGCSVVCSTCSRALNKDRLNSGLCVVCRQQMTHVSYPDNSMKPTNSTH